MNWNRAFRNDYQEALPLNDFDARRVSECQVIPRVDLKTWYDVFLDGVRIGMVRVKLGGYSECKKEKYEESIYCGDASNLNRKDNRFALAILRLREITSV